MIDALIGVLTLVCLQDTDIRVTQPDDFFTADVYQSAVLSPSGQLVMTKVMREGREAVEILHPESGAHMVLADTGDGKSGTVSSMRWLGERSVMLLARSGTTLRWRYWIAGIDFGDGELSARFLRAFYQSGYLIDPLPLEEGAFLYAKTGSGGGVYRVTFDNKGKVPREAFRTRDRLNGRMTDAIAWFTDSEGSLRLAIKKEDEETYELWTRFDRRWKKILDLPEDIRFVPKSFVASTGRLYVLTDHESERLVARSIDVRTGEYAQTVYEHPDLDLSELLINPADGEPLGVSFVVDGRTERHYFDVDRTQTREMIAREFPSRTPYVIGRNALDTHELLYVESSDKPGQLLYTDLDRGQIIEIGSLAPQLETYTLGEVQVVHVRSEDGLDLEGYLTLPAAAKTGKVPLLVTPHGGPIGIRDVNHFNREAHYLASLGVAVLRTNYRGSGGFGDAFREAGKGQWGLGIEDDIDTMVDHVIEHFPVDATRICSYGSSYGGYSAVMSILRRPDRYRCAASFAGPMDLPLMFSSSDWNADQELVAEMQEIVGDPNTDMESLMAVSPVYRAAEISRPLFLAHGLYDKRVDIEHLYRMQWVFELLEKPLESSEWETGHGFALPAESRAYYRALSRFLLLHLDTGVIVLPEKRAPEDYPLTSDAPNEGEAGDDGGVSMTSSHTDDAMAVASASLRAAIMP